MFRPALILTALAALALPGGVVAKERPEWSACTLTEAPKRMTMQQAFTKGIPVEYRCDTTAKVLVTVSITDPKVRLTSDQRHTAIAANAGRELPELQAGETRSSNLVVSRGWPRKVLKRYPRARVAVEISTSLADGPIYGHPKNARDLTLVRSPTATAAAGRPEWTDCEITSLPRRYSMQKAFTTGIPAEFTCKSAEKAFLPVRIADRNVRLSGDRKMTAIAGDFMDVEPGVTQRAKLRIDKGWPRQVLKRYARVRVLVDMAADLGNGMYSNSDYARYVTLVR